MNVIYTQQCALCGRSPATGYASAYEDRDDYPRYYPLCHGDDDDTPTCYERWQWGERPEVAR